MWGGFVNNRAFLVTILILFVVSIGFVVGFSNKNYEKIETNSNNIETEKGSNMENSDKLTIQNNNEQSEINENDPNKMEEDEVIIPWQESMPKAIKAVYSTGWVMGTPSLRKAMINSVKENGFNAIVVDIKDESGQLTYDSEVQTAIDIKSSQKMVKDIKSVIDELKENDIFVIGRIVTFKDPIFASKVEGVAYQNQDGSIWHDYSGRCWPNPYNEKSWEYPIALAKEAAELGFQEIQFDYIRFPSSEGRVKNIAYGFDSDTKSKADVICAFLEKVKEELTDYNVPISADVFGITTKRDGDFEHIGQDFARISFIVDIVCPMVYPSHYANNEYKIARPDKDPYAIIKYSMIDAMNRLESYYIKEKNLENIDEEIADEEGISEKENIELKSGEEITETSKEINIRANNQENLREYGVKIRPYLQDFTASWLGKGNYLVYGDEEVKVQIQAAYDLGIDDFCLWDPSNKYCYGALNKINK